MDHHELNSKIAELGSAVRGSFFDSGNRDGQFWRGVWNLIREIGQDFRAVRFPTKAEKDEAWAAFQSIVDGVKKQQAQHIQERDQTLRSRESKDKESNELLGDVLSRAQAAWPHEDGFMDFLGLITGAQLLADIMIATIEILADVLTLGLLRTGEVDSRKAKLLGCSSQMKEAWAFFKANSKRLLPHHRDAAWKALTGVQGELDKEWDKWKAEQQQHREQRDSRLTQNRHAKEQLIAEARRLIGSHRDAGSRQRAKDLFQEWRQIRSAGKNDDESLWQEFRGTLDEFYDQSKQDRRRHILAEIEKVEDMIEKAKANRESNEERLAGARSSDYGDRVREWIADDDANIEKFEGWLDEWNEKLEQLDD